MVIVGFVCGAEGRGPEEAKVCRINNWTRYNNSTEAKAFMGICTYYRIWIQNYSQIAEPIYRLLKKDVDWEWGPEQEKAMEVLKEKLTSPPLLCKLHYDPEDGWGDIVLGVDASLTGWGGTLGQFDDKGKKRVSRFESGLWNHAEQQYDATKRECRGVLKCLQKLRFWLYGVYFILETDANTLVAQLNRVATDLPGALVTRWLAWIRLFDFEVRYIKGTKHSAADGLSRRPQCKDDSEDKLNIDDFVVAKLDIVRITAVDVEGKECRNKVNASGMLANFIGRYNHVT
jgi:RNase H-like domain found in reverse transcriptase